jgi:hypothetical protein
MRRVTSVSVAAAALVVATAADAQDVKRLTVAAGAAAFREQPPGDSPATTYDTGWTVAANYLVLWDRLGAVVDIGVNKRTNIVGEREEVKAYLFGARYDLTRAGRFTLFGQGLLGREKFTEPGFSEHGFAFQPGAGVDISLWKGLGARAEVDYRVTTFDEATFKAWRVVAGGFFGLD